MSASAIQHSAELQSKGMKNIWKAWEYCALHHTGPWFDHENKHQPRESAFSIQTAGGCCSVFHLSESQQQNFMIKCHHVHIYEAQQISAISTGNLRKYSSAATISWLVDWLRIYWTVWIIFKEKCWTFPASLTWRFAASLCFMLLWNIS